MSASTCALNAFYQALSDVTDYWNFSITPLTYDERFFYDVTHTRNAAANLVLARIAGNESVGLPDAFGPIAGRESQRMQRS